MHQQAFNRIGQYRFTLHQSSRRMEARHYCRLLRLQRCSPSEMDDWATRLFIVAVQLRANTSRENKWLAEM